MIMGQVTPKILDELELKSVAPPGDSFPNGDEVIPSKIPIISSENDILEVSK
jgi:hypothetical protein